MKTIEQLLELSKNPFYQFMPAEKQVLDDFLSKKREKDLKNSQEKNSPNSDSSTPVIVRNVVQKAPTYPPEAPENL